MSKVNQRYRKCYFCRRIANVRQTAFDFQDVCKKHIHLRMKRDFALSRLPRKIKKKLKKAFIGMKYKRCFDKELIQFNAGRVVYCNIRFKIIHTTDGQKLRISELDKLVIRLSGIINDNYF